jgi:hypothetical protein
MRFRRIYWVTEQIDNDGHSQVTGVFTSIPDLIELGIGVRGICDKSAAFRLTLVELDSREMPLISLESPDFDNYQSKLAPFLESGEVSREEFNSLADALQCRTV